MRKLLPVVYAFVCYLVLALAVTFPLVLALGSAVSDPVDAILNTWIMAYEHHALLTQPHELFNTNIFYPYPGTLLFSETLLLPSLLLLPVQVLTGNPLLTHNVLVLMGFTLTGTSAFLLGRWLFGGFWPALVVGALFAFNSYTLSNVGQAQLLHLEWLPLALLYTGRTLRHPTARNGLFVALFLAAQFYTVIYYGIFSFLVVGLVGAVAWLFRGYPSPQARIHSAAALGMGLLLAVALSLPLALGYYATSATFGFERSIMETWPYAASVETWTTALETNLVYGTWLGHALPKLGYYALDALFPGVLLLSLATVGLALGIGRAVGVLRTPHHPARWQFFLWPVFLLVGIAGFVLLSFGPYPQRQTLQPNFDVQLPYAWVHAWVPGFQALRAPVRFAAVVYLGLAVATAYTVRSVRWRIAQVGLVALLLGELWVVPTLALYTPHTSEDQRATYAWLATLPPTAYVELPIYPFGAAGQEAHWLESQYHSMRHWHATPDGYSGFFPPRHAELLDFIGEFPRPEVVELLQAMAVEWVVIHRNRITVEQTQVIDAAIQTQGWTVQQWGDVWAIHLPPRDQPLPTARYLLPDVAQAGGTLAIGAVLQSDPAVALKPGLDLGHVRAEWWQDDTLVLAADKVAPPPYYVDQVGVWQFTMPVPAQAGIYQLRLFSGGEPWQETASGVVNVVDDAAPPEVRLLPVRGLEATLRCDAGDNGDGVAVEVMMQTIGWYDDPFTLSARITTGDGDGEGAELARSARDIEFAPGEPHRTLLHVQPYTLPFDARPEALDQPISVGLAAYQWQQAAERVVPRHFVDDQGEVVATLTLPLTVAPTCGP